MFFFLEVCRRIIIVLLSILIIQRGKNIRIKKPHHSIIITEAKFTIGSFLFEKIRAIVDDVDRVINSNKL